MTEDLCTCTRTSNHIITNMWKSLECLHLLERFFKSCTFSKRIFPLFFPRWSRTLSIAVRASSSNFKLVFTICAALVNVAYVQYLRDWCVYAILRVYHSHVSDPNVFVWYVSPFHLLCVTFLWSVRKASRGHHFPKNACEVCEPCRFGTLSAGQ